MTERITKEEAVSFLLTYMVVERSVKVELNQLTLFEIMNLAAQGTLLINDEEAEVTPHEVLEELADEFISSHKLDDH